MEAKIKIHFRQISIVVYVLFIGFSLTLCSFLTVRSEVDLTIHVQNIKYDQGNLHIAVFSTGVDFPEEEDALQKTFKKIKGDRVEIHFTLPKGTYAVAVYQDIDEDGEHDKNFLGIPKEPFCFSNNVKPKLSTPGFEACAFTLNTSKTLFLELIN